MLNYTTGAPTARYWTLSLLLNHYGAAGGLRVLPALVSSSSSSLRSATVSSPSAAATIYAMALQNATGVRSLLLVNTQYATQSVSLTADWAAAMTEVGFP
jgi:hypothetical protein